MKKKSNILVVGAGAQGAPCAAILARQPGVERILLGAHKLGDAASICERLGSPKVTAAQFDAREPDTVARSAREALGNVDVVIDLTPSFISVPVMEAALALGAHYVNTAACPEHLAQLIHGQPLDLADRFVAAGRTALLGCGASPGVVNVICRRFCDELETVERIEVRAGFHIPAQKEMIKTWTPTWCPEQQYFDYCDPPCLFHDGKHEHMPLFHEPETYDFGENLGEVQLTHHAHDEQYSLPLTIGKGIQYCCYKFPFEPAIATLFATGFTQDRIVEVEGVKVKAIDVLMELLPRPVQIAVLDPQVQKDLVPFIADTRAHILIKGTSGGKDKTFRIVTGALFDQAAKALELFDTANVAVAYAAAAGALQLTEGNTKAGIVWPEELDAARFIDLSNTLGLTLNLSVS
ncbi:MAG TPA: saccharopine dehydrogenase NADP-binding domain-containing protein [Chthoniobacterales bacterium]|nr:saccharopine dehydrogenase NADP-binding domain-containing protein [Chthoniobacterales bacterium]